MPDMDPEISAIADHIRSQLSGISGDRHHPMRLAWLATSDQDGTAQVRTIVIRETSNMPVSVSFFTDRRSPKWQETLRHKSGSLLLFDRLEMEQIRLLGVFKHRCQTDCAAAWQAQDAAARQLYSGPAPGTPRDPSVTAGLEPAPGANPDSGKNNFGIIDLRVTSIDWLSISRNAHRRAIFDTTIDTHWSGHFVNP
jgi:hypothetical protein